MGIWQRRNREEGLGHDTLEGKLNKTNFHIKHICSFLYFVGVECVARVSGAPYISGSPLVNRNTKYGRCKCGGQNPCLRTEPYEEKRK